MNGFGGNCEVNSRQLVFDALEGRTVPRVPCGPLAVHFCAADAGTTIHDYSTNPKRLAESVIHYYEKYRPDAIWISADTWVTAEAMGAEVAAPGPNEPFAGRPDGFVHSASDLAKIVEPDPATQGRQPMMLEALRSVRRELGDSAFIVGCFDQSPFSLACAVGGISQIMMKTIMEPDFVRALLVRCSDYVIRYGQAMAACGADMLSTGDSPAGLVGPELYRSFCLPAQQTVFAALHNSTDCKLSLHICGDASAILTDMAKSGADVIELDQSVDLSQAFAQLPEQVAIWGNIDPVKILWRGTTDEVRRASHEALIQAVSANRRFVLSSGCTLAPNTPPGNVHALIESTYDELAAW